MLVEHLPPESATKTEIRNAVGADEVAAHGEYRPDLGQWSATEMMLAAIRDELMLSRYVAIAAAGGKPPEFHPTPRPGVPPTSAQRTGGGMTDEMRRALDPRLREQPMEA
ncbi:hypothetical protein [Streptomyces sp. NPDC048603]|uniref:hypothetical protein n=1 Tax=Streptomyces sp. NPDC048603 TaxID=3365577 RepID=UPI00371E99E1